LLRRWRRRTLGGERWRRVSSPLEEAWHSAWRVLVRERQVAAAWASWVVHTERARRGELRSQLDAARSMTDALQDQVQRAHAAAMETEYWAQLRVADSRALYEELYGKLQELSIRNSRRETKVFELLQQNAQLHSRNSAIHMAARSPATFPCSSPSKDEGSRPYTEQHHYLKQATGETPHDKAMSSPYERNINRQLFTATNSCR